MNTNRTKHEKIIGEFDGANDKRIVKENKKETKEKKEKKERKHEKR